MKYKALTASVFCFALVVPAVTQQPATRSKPLPVPDAPQVHSAAPNLAMFREFGPAQAAQTGSASSGQQSPTPATAGGATQPQLSGQLPKLALSDAEQIALKNHPRITIAQLTALASRQVVREVRAGLLPTIASNTTGVDVAHDGNRITAGVLNNPSVFQRAASGLVANQLITDFGRTTNLTASANLNAQAQDQNALATREQIVYLVDQAFFNALSAQALVQVADETVRTRQVLVDQVTALEQAKLRSSLDLSFANVSLAQAQLLLVNARNNRDATYAALGEALGLPDQKLFDLVDPNTPETTMDTPEKYIQDALQNRPDLKSLEFSQSSAERFTTAERRLQFPTISALGAAGLTPVASDRLGTNGYGAVGVNIQIPIFNGFLFSARASEAELRARATAERVRELRDTIARQVRTAWLDANSAVERQHVAGVLLQQANLSLDLAQARYKLGLSSIVELSQAQLQQTEAQISTVTAKYQYEFAVAALSYQTGSITH